jgi:NAD(P)-dependent dehydrogenase (short-subunit alcohol dehydrogenase family)
LSARRALITGGSRGIGLSVGRMLADRGWRVTLVARDGAALESALGALPGGGHETLALDVADVDAWEQAAARLEDVTGLVCAAGVLAPVGPIGTYSVAEFRRTLETNVLGTVQAISSCLPALRARRGAVVTLSGGGATKPLPRFDAYAASKAAVARLSENLAPELERDGVRINCVAPGFVATEIHRATLAAGPELAGRSYFEHTRSELEHGGVPASEAAELVCLLLENNDDQSFTGKLISAQWDPWRDADFRRRLVENEDLATLRRIDDALFTATAAGTPS